ncbi:transglycosylase SLT domain-containing protein [Klebsiella pneumoniae subsp. pneumoniae]|nr:transglycosylase SLT domain-containing protein [Klebsiella pneumoniae subsp. pneumoniae]
MGLMQVVQHSAGRDVFRSQGKSGLPSRSYLFDPANNIDTGTAYPGDAEQCLPRRHR